MEAAEKNERSLDEASVTITTELVQRSTQLRKEQPLKDKMPCYRCGKGNHTAASCHLKSETLQDKLSWFIFWYYNIPQSTTDASPSQLLLGWKMRSPLMPFTLTSRGRLSRNKTSRRNFMTSVQDSVLRSQAMHDAVYARNSNLNASTTPWLPGKLTHWKGTRSFQVLLPDGHTCIYHPSTYPPPSQEIGRKRVSSIIWLRYISWISYTVSCYLSWTSYFFWYSCCFSHIRKQQSWTSRQLCCCSSIISWTPLSNPWTETSRPVMLLSSHNDI